MKTERVLYTLGIVIVLSLLIATSNFEDEEITELSEGKSLRGSIGNDAGSGEDAGMNIDTSLTLEAENIGSRSYDGDLSNDIDDWRDVYLITPPDDYFVCIELSWDGAFDLDLWFGDAETGDVTKSSRYSGNYNPEVVTHNNFDNETFFIAVFTENESEAGLLEYQLSIIVDSTPRINAICQDDAGYGIDAYSGYSNHTEIVPINSPGLTSTSGYISVDEDEWDTYHMFVPNNKGLAVWLYFDESAVDSKISMFQDPDEDTLDFSHDNYPEMVSSNGSASYPGGIVENLVVYIHVGAETGSGEYTLHWFLFELDYDGDGVIDENDAFPEDASESSDTDSDGIGNNADLDDDNDGWDDITELQCYTNPKIASNFPSDYDSDGLCDSRDSDDDNDDICDGAYEVPGVCTYGPDPFPKNPNEWKDTDADGIGDNADLDDDNDGWDDSNDAFPLDNTEWLDNDNDGLGDNTDSDDDNDGWTDKEEEGCGDYDQFDVISQPSDSDLDGECDAIDIDDDNDSILDWEDECLGFDDNLDYDSDGLADGCDTDDDEDGVIDDLDKCQPVLYPDMGNVWQGGYTWQRRLLSANDTIDVDYDGIPDGCDTLIDTDGDSISNFDDACEGHDDFMDIDQDGTPDACDFWHPNSEISNIYYVFLTAVILSTEFVMIRIKNDIK